MDETRKAEGWADRKKGEAMENLQTNAMIVNENDHVIMTTELVKGGQMLCWRDAGGIHTLPALEDIPKYHKAAVKAVKQGEQVLKYGENIGRALADIEPGAWVHTHNISDYPEVK